MRHRSVMRSATIALSSTNAFPLFDGSVTLVSQLLQLLHDSIEALHLAIVLSHPVVEGIFAVVGSTDPCVVLVYSGSVCRVERISVCIQLRNLFMDGLAF